MSKQVRVAVIGAGVFGRHHLRILKNSPQAELIAVVDNDPQLAGSAANDFGCRAAASIDELFDNIDAAVIAAPTSAHAEIGVPLLENGIDVLVEKPIAATHKDGQRLVNAAAKHVRILQVGHLERFNPAVTALRERITIPLFFEIHRLSLFSPRSLDVDVVLDLMIHDLDIVLSLVGSMPIEVRAAGIQILSKKVDIANVRLAFANGCIANLTASRVSTERVRKLRLFQPHQYISLDYEKQQAAVFSASPEFQIGFETLAIEKSEPLRLEVEDFLQAVADRRRPRVSGEDGLRALEAALDILAKIEEHTDLVARQLPPQ
jgi:predicted dehydrogenase